MPDAAPIRCVLTAGGVIAQGEAVNPDGLQGEAHDKPDMHGLVAVRIGKEAVAVGRPIDQVRRIK